MSDSTQQEIKRFVAPSMSRALELVRLEMGPDAIILSSERTARGVEIITSLETDLPTRGADTRKEFGHKFDADIDSPLSSDNAWQTQAGIDDAAAKYGGRVEHNNSSLPKSEASSASKKSSKRLAEDIERARERMFSEKSHSRKAESRMETPQASLDVKPQAKTSFSEIVQSNDDQKLKSLESELADMRMLLEQQFWRPNPMSQGVQGEAQVLPQQSLLNEHLQRLGLTPEVIKHLIGHVGAVGRVSELWRNSLATLAKQFPVVKDDLVMNGGVFAFVGQTGVGKTTTIAKLAARYVLEHGAGKVALVTTDNHRVGAQHQLRSLGRILNVPVKALDDPKSLPTLLASLKNFPLVLIDTAGFRLGDPLLTQQLEMLDTCPTLRRVLVLACNSQLQALKASASAYVTRSAIDACVLTKLDESFSIGEAMSVVMQQSLAVAYTTHGQSIPEDIELATGHSIVAKASAMVRTEQQPLPSVANF